MKVGTSLRLVGLLAIMACATQPLSDEIVLKEFTNSMTKSDSTALLKTLSDVDQLLKSGKSKIENLAYNKAQLLFRLNRVDDAIQTLTTASFRGRDLYLATLLVRSGRIDSAGAVLDGPIAEIQNELKTSESEASLRTQRLDSLILYLQLGGLSKKQIAEYIFERRIADASELEQLMNNQVDLESLLSTIWPN